MIAQPSTEIPSGTTLGKYDILRKLATGGMAEIYLARGRGQAGFEKLVVLKRILPQVAADPTFVRMFLEEAKLAATLRHPHIADVWDVDCVDGMYFYTMEYIHGQDVRAIRAASRKRNERMPLAIAVGIISAVASALEYAHDRTGSDGGSLGLVHRDISASNVLVSYDGAIKLLDFGIAHAADRSENTRTGSIKGKVPYMSPEQCQGRRLDRRSDLFSLGTVLYELTVGRRPFRGDSDYVIMEQIVRVDPMRPTELDAEYPPELERIVLRLLSRDLETRYRSADELISDLERFQTSAGLWVSAKVISRFMRSLFWDNIEAWESASRDGSLEKHITTVNVHDRGGFEAVTPPSAFPIATTPAPGPRILPFASVPESGPVIVPQDTRVEVRRPARPNPTGPEAAIPLPFGALPNTTGPILTPRASSSVTVPDSRPPAPRPLISRPPTPTSLAPSDPVTRSSVSVVEVRPPRRGLAIAVASVVMLIGVTGGYLLVSSMRDKEPVVNHERAPAPTPTPAVRPAPKQPAAKVEPKPESVAPKPETKAETKPETKAPPKRTKPDQNSPTEKKTIKLKPEETTWDPNSPVLPPRR